MRWIATCIIYDSIQKSKILRLCEAVQLCRYVIDD